MINVLYKSTIRSVSRNIAIWTILHGVHRKSRDIAPPPFNVIYSLSFRHFIAFHMTRVRYFTFLTLSEFLCKKKSFTASIALANECLRDLTRSFFSSIHVLFPSFVSFPSKIAMTRQMVYFGTCHEIKEFRSNLFFLSVFAQTETRLFGRNMRLNREVTRERFIVKIMMQDYSLSAVVHHVHLCKINSAFL